MAISSPLSTAANNIVKIGNRSERALPKAQKEFQDFSRFLEIEIIKLQKTQLPDKRKIKNLANINIVNNFGSAGNLLSNLLGGGLDLANFISGFFPGKGEKVGKRPQKGKVQPKPKVSGGKLKIGGIRALGIANAVFAGLDFATGLAEGESVGKAASGAAGSFGGALAGSLLAGAVGQALIPIPGVGFVLGLAGGAAGGFLGGYSADRVYEALTGETKQKQEQKIKEQEQKQKSSTKRDSTSTQSFSEVLMKFNESVIKFEDFASNIGSIMGVGYTPEDTYTEGEDRDQISPGGGPSTPSGGEVPSSPDGLPGLPPTNTLRGQAYGSPRRYGKHTGQDFDISGNEKFYSRLGGEVIFAKDVGGAYGNVVEVYNKDLGVTEVIAEANNIMPNIKPGMLIAPGTPVVYGERTKSVEGSVGVIHYEIVRGVGGISTRNNNTMNPLEYLNSQKYRDYIAGKTGKGSGKKEGELKQNVLPQIPTQNQTQVKPQQIPPQSQATIAQTQQISPTTQSLPQMVMAAPQREEKQIQSYPSYSQGQSYIMEKETIISAGGGGGGSRQTIIPVGGGGSGQTIVISPETGSLVLNSLMKSILLTSLSSS